MIAAIYSRKSKLSEKGESVENQVQMCREYLTKNFNKIHDIRIYEDEGFSGKDINRPEFKKMIKAARDKKFDILICYRLDRISRNVADFSNTIQELQKLGIEFISIKEQFDTSTPMGRAMMNIAAVFAQLERETIAERIKDNMLELAKTGRWLGGTAPLGYKSEPIVYINDDGKNKKMFKLDIIKEEISIAELIFKLYLEKKGFPSVATYLCKNMYKGKNGGEFSKGTVEQIIKNPVYCIADKKILEYFKRHGAIVSGEPNGVNGLMVYNKREDGKKDKPVSEWIIAVGKHQGIITSSDWIKCQEINLQNKMKASPRSGTGDKFLLSGLVVCGECGSGMSSWSHFNSKYGYMDRYYRCNLKNRASTRCGNKMLNAYKAEEEIVSYLKNTSIDKLLDVYDEDKSKVPSNVIKSEIEKLEKQYEKNKIAIQGLVRKMAFLNDDINIINIMKEEIILINNENEQIQKQINENKSIIENTEEIDDIVNQVADSLESFKKFYDFADFEGKRSYINGLIKNIIWYSDTEIIKVVPKTSNSIIPQGLVKRRNI